MIDLYQYLDDSRMPGWLPNEGVHVDFLASEYLLWDSDYALMILHLARRHCLNEGNSILEGKQGALILAAQTNQIGDEDLVDAVEKGVIKLSQIIRKPALIAPAELFLSINKGGFWPRLLEGQVPLALESGSLPFDLSDFKGYVLMHPKGNTCVLYTDLA